MKFCTFFRVSALLLASSLPLLSTGSDCYNDDPDPDCPDCESSQSGAESAEASQNYSSEACETDGNPFAIYSGNTLRRVDDLQFWNTPGTFDFRWSRTAKSRLVQGAPSYFGNAHQWFHNWDVRLADAGTDPRSGQRLIEIRHANGRKALFRASPGANFPWTPLNANWRGQERLTEKKVAAGDTYDGFEVLMHNGTTLRFYQHDFGQGALYRLDEVLDPLQNIYSLTYANDSAWKLLQVSAPGGDHSFSVTWGASNGLQVITKVTASDGRTVDYDYQQMNDPADNSKHQALFQADYSDGTYGYYRYNWQRNSYRRPLLGQARDPRVRSGARIVKYRYNSVFFGMITAEKNLFDNSDLVTRSTDPQTGLITINYGNGSSRTLDVSLGAGRVSGATSATGGQVTHTYGGYLNRSLRSTTDSNHKKITYSWRSGDFLRPTRVLYDEDGGTQHEKRYAYTSTGLLLSEKVHPSSGGWFNTVYTRDANGHLTGKTFPDGTSES